jgi:hypothetical protein
MRDMKHINLDGLVPKRIKILCLRLVLVSVLVIACSFVVAAQGNQNSEIANNEKPDLVVDSIIWEPINPKTRDDVTVSIVCANRGDAPTVKGFSIYLYVDDQLVETKYLKPLNAGSSENVPPITWKVDEDIIGGTHTFFAYVNQDKSGSKSYIKESDNSNNQRSETFYVTSRLPDLKLVDISWRPLYISNGDSVTFAVDYSNIGHMSTDKRTTIWLYVDNKLVNKAKNIGLLAPDETGSVQIPWTVGRDFKGGEHDVTAYIDRDKDNNHYSNVVQEENEQNNMISKVFWTNRNESFTDITIVVKDINSKPIESANIFVDKNYVGNTDSRGELTSKVTEGQKHTIEAESYGYLTKEKDITVKYNSKLQPFSIFLEYGSAPVTLYVKSSSKEPIINAEVSVGGDSIGTTNSNGVLKFEAGKDSIVTVEINKRGYYSYGPVGISVSKYGASETIELNPVPKPVIKFWSTNNASHVGNETIFTLGALNPMTSPEDVTVQLVITPPSGVLVDATYFVKSGGVFYQNTEPIAPGRESKITLSMIGNEVGYYTIPANVYYYYSNQGKDKIPELNTTLSLQVNSNEIVEPKSPTPHWLPGFGAPSFILVMLIAASINRLQKKQVWQ